MKYLKKPYTGTNTAVGSTEKKQGLKENNTFIFFISIFFSF